MYTERNPEKRPFEGINKEDKFTCEIRQKTGDYSHINMAFETDNITKALENSLKFYKHVMEHFVVAKPDTCQNQPIAQAELPVTTQPETDSGLCCQKCGSVMTDNRATKAKETSPDYKCTNKTCGAAAWFSKYNPGELSWSK